MNEGNTNESAGKPEQGKKSKQARRTGQIVARGDNKFLVRVFIGRDEATGKRSYYNKTVRGTKKDAQH